MSLTDTVDEQHARLTVLRASEAELTEGPDAALLILGPPTDPIRMRATLGTLIRANRYQIAADLIRDRRPDDKWLDLAALVFAHLGDIERARYFCELADESSDVLVMRHTRLALAEGVFETWRERYVNQSFLAIRNWSESDIELAHTLTEILDPLLAVVRANRRIQGDLELEGVHYSAYLSHITASELARSQTVGWLVRHTPVPLIVAELCLRGMASCSTGLPSRLRVEHPGNFQAAYLAALVERELLNRPADAFDALVRLASDVTSDEEREIVSIALFETCGDCEPEKTEQAAKIIAGLRSDDSRLLGLLDVAKRTLAGDLPGAREKLDALRNDTDGVWWQTHAQLCQKEGNEDGAQEAWEKASELLPHPDVIRRSVQASLNRRKLESAVRGLTRLLEISPDSQKDLHNIAWALEQLGDYAKATAHLERLVELDPSNANYRLWLARTLARSARTQDAIAALQSVCDSEAPPVEAILLESELLESDGRAPDAFRLLKTIAGDHWDEPEFLLRYTRCGHAAGEDRLAHDAFARLLELRPGGKVPTGVIQVGTLEQLLEYGKEYRNRRESLQGAVIDGRMPWLFVEDILGHPAVWAWKLHTQSLDWHLEERLSCAAYTIYATNGFTVCESTNGRRLKQITTAAKGHEVVADLSALITLHQLGQLEHAAEYFGRISLPATYGDLRIREASRFGQHQPSRKAELVAIRKELDAGRIHVVEADRPELIPVNEHSDEPGQHAYRLCDLISPLSASQRASANAFSELREVAHRPSAICEGYPGFGIGDSLLIDLATLRTLADKQVFEPILSAFTVFILAEQRDEVIAELRAHNAANEARTAHDALWDSVNQLINAGRILWRPMPVDSQRPEEPDDDTVPPIHLHALTLAKHMNKSLVVDDRMLQVGMFQEDSTSASRAFGCDCLLQSLAEAEICNWAEMATDYRQLMQWRYRFLIPPPQLLLQWAKAYIDNLPGDALLDVAFYLHDCLRDPGQLRYTSLDVRSVWAMSLVAELGRTNIPIPKEPTLPDVWERIGTIVRGYLISTTLGQKHDEAEAVFAFQDRVSSRLGGWENWICEDERNGFLQVFELRNRLVSAQELQSQLERLAVLPEEEQRLTLVFVNEAVRSTFKYDEVIVAWLAQTEGLVNAVQQLSGLSLMQLLDLIAEFHQRQRAEWAIQLPHVLAYILEQTTDAERAQQLIGHILLMSISSGIVSPIQRIAASRWRADVAKLLPNWRDSIVDIGRLSEPWVRARIRATSAAISRLIGPRSWRAMDTAGNKLAHDT